MTLGAHLKMLRERHGLSRQELAEKLRISYWALAKYEQDERSPDYETITQIAGFFDVSLDYLLGQTDDPTPAKKRNGGIATEAAHRTDDPMDDLPEEARKSLEEFRQFIFQKYGKKGGGC